MNSSAGFKNFDSTKVELVNKIKQKQKVEMKPTILFLNCGQFTQFFCKIRETAVCVLSSKQLYACNMK